MAWIITWVFLLTFETSSGIYNLIDGQYWAAVANLGLALICYTYLKAQFE